MMNGEDPPPERFCLWGRWTSSSDGRARPGARLPCAAAEDGSWDRLPKSLAREPRTMEKHGSGMVKLGEAWKLGEAGCHTFAPTRIAAISHIAQPVPMRV